MNKISLFLSVIVLLFVASGCLNEMRGQKITVQKRMGEENSFKEFREVTKRKQVNKAIAIVKGANWKTKKEEMTRFADYQFQFPLKYGGGDESKIASYLLWVNPIDERVEIVTDSKQYVELGKKDSLAFYEILTGEDFTE